MDLCGDGKFGEIEQLMCILYSIKSESSEILLKNVTSLPSLYSIQASCDQIDRGKAYVNKIGSNRTREDTNTKKYKSDTSQENLFRISMNFDVIRLEFVPTISIRRPPQSMQARISKVNKIARIKGQSYRTTGLSVTHSQYKYILHYVVQFINYYVSVFTQFVEALWFKGFILLFFLCTHEIIFRRLKAKNYFLSTQEEE